MRHDLSSAGAFLAGFFSVGDGVLPLNGLAFPHPIEYSGIEAQLLRSSRRGVVVASLSLLIVSAAMTAEPAASAPTITTTTAVSGLEIPWDVTWVGSLMLFNQRAGTVWSKRSGDNPRRVNLPLPPIYNQREAGLLGMVADPEAKSNGYFYTCMSVATADGRPSDVEVWKWRLTSDTSASRVTTLIKGIPIEDGGHNGCRLVFRSSRALYVGTGDAVNGTSPQSLKFSGRQDPSRAQRWLHLPIQPLLR